MLRRTASLLFLAASVSAFGFCNFSGDHVRDAAALVENFIMENLRRIDDCWTMAFSEFEKAREELQEEPAKIGRKLRENLSESIKEGVKKGIREGVDHALKEPSPAGQARLEKTPPPPPAD